VREGFLLLSHFVPLLLAGIGVNYIVSPERKGLEKAAVMALFLVLIIYSWVDTKPAFLTVGVAGTAWLALMWVGQRGKTDANSAFLIGLFLCLSAGFVLRDAYDFPPTWQVGSTAEEHAIHYLQERYNDGDVLASEVPLPAVAAKMRQVDITTMPDDTASTEALMQWIGDNDISALFVTPGFIESYPNLWKVVRLNMGAIFEVGTVEDPGSIQVIEVVR
jgi:hypothetical protein